MESIIEKSEDLEKLIQSYQEKNYLKFLEISNYLRENSMHLLGYCIERKLFDSKHQEIVETNYNHPTTLRTIFGQYEFEQIHFQNPSFKFENEEDEKLLEITQIGEMGMGVFPKKFDHSSLSRFWEKGMNHFYLYPQILDIEVKLNSFYEDVSPKNLFLSKRKTQREIAEYFYLKFLIYNNYSQEQVNNFVKNYCFYSSLLKIAERKTQKKYSVVISEEGADMRVKREFGQMVVEFNYCRDKYKEEKEIFVKLSKILNESAEKIVF